MKGKKLFIALLMSAPPSLWAGTCALCREALRSGGSPGLIKGFYWSIILLVSIPLVVLGVGLRFVWKQYR